MIGNIDKETKYLSYYLAKEFETKVLGRLKYFPDTEVAHLRQDISISQQKNVKNFF